MKSVHVLPCTRDGRRGAGETWIFSAAAQQFESLAGRDRTARVPACLEATVVLRAAALRNAAAWRNAAALRNAAAWRREVTE